MRYYSYCTCGKPVTNRAYTLSGRTLAGEPVQLRGHTDFFGMLLARDIAEAGVDYGVGQRARKRSYDYVAGTEQTRHKVLGALNHPDPNDTLTALLDLRIDPLPGAKQQLIALLDKDNEVVWRNAAVTLSYYEDISPVVEHFIGRMNDRGANTERVAFILGALRRPAAIAPLSDALKSDNAALRRVAAWSLGFIAHDDGRAVLAGHADDPNPAVRAEVALALGRIGGAESLDVLEDMQNDADPTVVRRARMAIERL